MLKLVKDCVIPSFFPIVAVIVDDLAKFAPKLPPKFTLFAVPAVLAIAVVTALPKVFATAVPVVCATLLEIVLVSPLVIVSEAVLPSALAVLVLHPRLEL